MAANDRTIGIIAGSSISSKKINQDAFAIAQNERLSIGAVVVADGLGSHYGAEVASSIASKSIARYIEDLDKEEDLNLCAFYVQAWHEIVNYTDQHQASLPEGLNWNEAFGTTAICAVDTPNVLRLAYIGNGAIFHLRGNFNRFPSSQLLPWSAMNYLNPHTLPEDGRNAMYKFLSPRSEPASQMPTVLSLNKDNEFFGDIICCVSDGISSYDQTPVGKDAEQRIWIAAEPAVTRLFQTVSDFFDAEHTEEALTIKLERYLNDLSKVGHVQDDCTVAVLITRRALKYQTSTNGSHMPRTL